MTTPQSQDQKTTKWFLIGSLIALVVLVGCFSFAWLALRKGPADVTEEYFVAVRDGDRQAMVELICAEKRHQAKKDIAEWNPDEDPSWREAFKWKVISEEIHGDRATVVVEMAGDDEEYTMTQKVQLSREGGDWKICEF